MEVEVMLSRGTERGLLHVAVVGYGAIGQTVVAELHRARGGRVRVVALMTRSSVGSTAESGRLVHAHSIEQVLQARPDVVVECASHDAVRQYGRQILDAGCDLVVTSTGALADDQLCRLVMDAAEKSGARVIVPAGAIGATDMLGAMRLAQLDVVRYVGTKAPSAWRGTPAERIVDLDRVVAPVVFFRGSARDAATSYPKNANVAATLAWYGAGFDKTEVTLVADPACVGNRHGFEAIGRLGTFRFESEGQASANPKTSSIVAYSICHSILG
jgi:aspartate dehydrogenase